MAAMPLVYCGTGGRSAEQPPDPYDNQDDNQEELRTRNGKEERGWLPDLIV